MTGRAEVQYRDRGLRRVAILRRLSAPLALGLVATFSVVAANAQPGHTQRRAPAVTAPPRRTEDPQLRPHPRDVEPTVGNGAASGSSGAGSSSAPSGTGSAPRTSAPPQPQPQPQQLSPPVQAPQPTSQAPVTSSGGS